VTLQVHNQLAIQVTNLQLELDNANIRLEEEAEAGENARSQTQRALADLQQAKAKHDKDLAALMEQFDDARLVVIDDELDSMFIHVQLQKQKQDELCPHKRMRCNSNTVVISHP
jgi:hypothetical protein